MNFIKVLRQPHLALLWSSQVLSAIGDYLYSIAVIWLAVQVAGSAAGIVAAAQAGAALLLGLIGGVYADRWNRRRTMITVDLLRAGAVSVLPVLTLLGILHLWHLVIVAVIVGSLGALFNPALQASLPALSSDAHVLQAANGLMDVTRRLARAIGPSIAGALVLLLPVAHFFTLDALSFLISALAILALGNRFAWQPVADPAQTNGLRGIAEEIAGVLRHVRRHKPVAWMIMIAFPNALFWSAAFMVGVPLLAAHTLDGNIGSYGLIVGAYGVGNVISNLIIGSITMRRRVTLMLAGRLIVGGGFLLMISVPVLPVALLGAALAATGGPMADIPLLVLIQTELPPNQIGKATSLRMILENGGNLIGLLLAIPLFHYLSPPLGIALCACIIAGLSLAGLVRFGLVEPAARHEEASISTPSSLDSTPLTAENGMKSAS
jgi:DHA3 family macrolide efflux protein-like MFS transporter